MRATYEDLLRTARRLAVNVDRSTYADLRELVESWDAVTRATIYHLRLLRAPMQQFKLGARVDSRADNSMHLLAQAIGAGADLLAAQDAVCVAGLVDGAGLVRE
jgi:hypothetical protein